MYTKYCIKCGYPMRRVKDEENNKIITICSNIRCNHMYARKITKRGVQWQNQTEDFAQGGC